jgi:periplasmic protein TonB
MLQLGLETTPDEDNGTSPPWTAPREVARAGNAKMTPMSGAALTPAPPGRRPPEQASDELFTGLVASNPRKPPRSLIMPASLVGHAIAIAVLILFPVLWPSALPEERDRIIGLIYNPPPPPPPPLPKGAALLEKQQPSKPVTPETKPEKPEFTAKIDVPKETPLKPEARDPDTEQAGSATGSDLGVPEGMEEGVEGGVVGGTPGGVLGGVIGGTGDGPVLDYDQPPRVLKQTKPVYPQEAFVKKIEGVVELEVIIDSTGRVRVQRIVHSVPALDEAAMQTVRQWVFSPAVKQGRPVSTLARIPVTFRIY